MRGSWDTDALTDMSPSYFAAVQAGLISLDRAQAQYKHAKDAASRRDAGLKALLDGTASLDLSLVGEVKAANMRGGSLNGQTVHFRDALPPIHMHKVKTPPTCFKYPEDEARWRMGVLKQADIDRMPDNRLRYTTEVYYLVDGEEIGAVQTDTGAWLNKSIESSPYYRYHASF